MLGGISGYEVTETSDENPARVAVVQRVTLAYLRSALLDDATAWPSACEALAGEPAPLGCVEGIV
jgi:hypothetical protein